MSWWISAAALVLVCGCAPRVNECAAFQLRINAVLLEHEQRLERLEQKGERP